jgi:hypothetical protein
MKEFVLFLFEVDFDEVLFIPIPEEIVEFLDEVPGFPSDLDFPLIFHFFLPFSSGSIFPLSILSAVTVFALFGSRPGTGDQAL